MGHVYHAPRLCLIGFGGALKIMALVPCFHGTTCNHSIEPLKNFEIANLSIVNFKLSHR